MIKMEIRSATITYSKNKSKSNRNREQELIRKLDHLDGTICNNFSSPLIDGVLREYDELKTELQSIYEEKGIESKLYFEQNAAGWKTENTRQNISSI